MKRIAVYFQSWSSKWVKDPTTMDLAQLKPPITIVNISFVFPDCTYVSGQQTFKNTGLNFSHDFHVVKSAIAILKKKGIKVMLAVGKKECSDTIDLLQEEEVIGLLQNENTMLLPV